MFNWSPASGAILEGSGNFGGWGLSGRSRSLLLSIWEYLGVPFSPWFWPLLISGLHDTNNLYRILSSLRWL